MALPERLLGETGLRVSRLGLGLAALGRPAYINLGHDDDFAGDRSVSGMRRRTHEVLDAAFAAGIRYVDAARSYGRAEEFLAGWLADRALPPDALTIGTKWGYSYVAGWRTQVPVHEVKDHSLATLRRQVEESVMLLGDRIDLLQVHSATLDSGIFEADDVLDELARLRAEGVVRAIGLTLSGAGQGETLRRAMRMERGGRRLWDAVQATFNALETSAAEALAAAHDGGMGVLVKETVANGRLVRGEAVDAIRPTADRLGTTPDALAIAYVLAQPWADVVLLGPDTVPQLTSNLRALGVMLDADALAALRALAEPAERYWRARSGLPWH